MIGPYFYDGILTGHKYLDFLKEMPLPLDYMPLYFRQEMYFLQDGAPPHNCRIVTDYFNIQFSQKLISTKGPIESPPRSPNLTPLDFFLWGNLKREIHSTQPTPIEELKNRIVNACQKVTYSMLENVSKNILVRYEKCVENSGGNFEQYL